MKKKRALLKLLGVFSLVRGYNIAFVCVAQYLAAIFVLSHKSWREVLFDDSLLILVIEWAFAISGGYIINCFYNFSYIIICIYMLFSITFFVFWYIIFFYFGVGYILIF